MILENVKVSWAKLREDNKADNFDGNGFEWQIQAFVSEEFANKWNTKKMSPIAKQDEETKEWFIRFKRKTVWEKTGDDKKPPTVVDKYGEPFNENIGNGSICNIQYAQWDWKFGAKSGTSTEITAVQVVELVEYKAADSGSVEFSYDKKEVVPLADLPSEEEDIPF